MFKNNHFSYFEIQALMGTTKHMGGLEATRELIELCPLNRGQTVLEVGCGVGATAVHLARECGCRVVGVDVRESMIIQAEGRAEREGLTAGGALRFPGLRAVCGQKIKIAGVGVGGSALHTILTTPFA